MSQWTHVAGIIRFDALRMLGVGNPPDLGATCGFESPPEAWEACTVPKGSEGSLKHELWENPDMTSLSAYVATIHGDLRDYSDEAEIVAYFNRLVPGEKSGLSIRQGCFTVEVEYKSVNTYVYLDEAKAFVRSDQL